MSVDLYALDDFFANPDETVDVDVTFGGKTLLFRVLRRLDYATRQGIQLQSLEVATDAATGDVTVTGVDATKATTLTLVAIIKEWPSKRPITAENIKALDPDLIQAIVSRHETLVNPKQMEKALDPSEAPSAEV